MTKQLNEAIVCFLYLCLLACFVAFALAVGMLLMPFAMLIVLMLAIREIIIWRRKALEERVPVRAIPKTRAKQRMQPHISVARIFSRLKQQFQFDTNHRRMRLDY